MTRILHCVMAIPETYDFLVEVMLPSIDLDPLPSDFSYEMHILGQGYNQIMVDAIKLLSDYLDLEITVTPIKQVIFETGDSRKQFYRTRAQSFKSGYDFYLFTDEDFRFTEDSFTHYFESIRYLQDNPDCALVMSSGFRGAQKNRFEPRPHCRLLWTSLGIIIRNLERDLPDHYTNGVIWKEPLNWGTSYQDDYFICYSPLEYGYYTAKHYRCRTTHYHIPSGLTPEGLEKTRRIPQRYKHYFEWKLSNRSKISELDKVSDLDKDGDGEDLIWMKRLFDIPSRSVLSVDNFMDVVMPCNNYLKEVYEPKAMERFGRAPLMDCK